MQNQSSKLKTGIFHHDSMKRSFEFLSYGFALLVLSFYLSCFVIWIYKKYDDRKGFSER